jgi:hypothetical protein
MSSTLSPEIQQQLTALTPQLNADKVNASLQKQVKAVINSLITEIITLKRENAQLKTENTSKS